MEEKYHSKKEMYLTENDSEEFGKVFVSLCEATSPLDSVDKSYEEVLRKSLITRINSHCLLVPSPTEREFKAI